MSENPAHRAARDTPIVLDTERHRALAPAREVTQLPEDGVRFRPKNRLRSRIDEEDSPRQCQDENGILNHSGDEVLYDVVDRFTGLAPEGPAT